MLMKGEAASLRSLLIAEVNKNKGLTAYINRQKAEIAELEKFKPKKEERK